MVTANILVYHNILDNDMCVVDKGAEIPVVK